MRDLKFERSVQSRICVGREFQREETGGLRKMNGGYGMGCGGGAGQ